MWCGEKLTTSDIFECIVVRKREERLATKSTVLSRLFYISF